MSPPLHNMKKKSNKWATIENNRVLLKTHTFLKSHLCTLVLQISSFFKVFWYPTKCHSKTTPGRCGVIEGTAKSGWSSGLKRRISQKATELGQKRNNNLLFGRNPLFPGDVCIYIYVYIYVYIYIYILFYLLRVYSFIVVVFI